MVPYAISGAVFNLALDRDKEVKKLFEEVKADLTLGVCQKLFSPLDHINVEGWAKRLAKEAGYRYEKGKGPPPGNQMVIMRELLKGSLRIVKRYTSTFSLVVKIFPWLNRDMAKFVSDLNELITVAFNRKSDASRRRAKVTASTSEALVQAIVFQAYCEMKGLKIDKLAEMKTFKHGNKSYSLSPEKAGDMSERAKREQVRLSIEASFKSVDVERLGRSALWWYESRVVHEGPLDYCNYLAKTTEEELDPSYLSNETRVCDQALGYEREKRGKRTVTE
jgi:hypothetical protein